MVTVHLKKVAYNKFTFFPCTPIFLIFISLFFPSIRATAQEPALEMDTVVFKVLRDGKQAGYITGMYGEQGCYVRIFEVLDFLGYKYEADWQNHSFTGYLPTKKKEYVIHNNTLTYSGQPAVISNSIIWSDIHDLFVNDGFLKELYDLNVTVNLNELAVIIRSSESTPYRNIDERLRKKAEFLAQQERIHPSNVDTLERSMFNLSAIGYSLMPTVNFSKQTDINWNARGTLNGELFKGVFGLSYIYSDNSYRKRWSNNLRFNWEKSDFGKQWLKTLLVDHDYPPAITSVRGYATSLTLSNDYRKSFLDRTFTYEGKTLPDVEVEIYNNGQLIEYVMSDSLGNFRAEVPVSGAENNITAVIYNALGVPTGTEKMVYIPAGLFIPNKFIYKFTAGVTDYGEVLIAPTVQYGASSWLTLSLGNETVIRSSGKTTSVMIGGAKFAFYKNSRFDVRYIPAVLLNTRIYGNLFEWFNANILYEHFNKRQNIIDTPVREHIQLDMSGGFSSSIKGNYNTGINYYSYDSGNLLSAYIGVNIWNNNWMNSFYFNIMEKKSRAYTLRLSYYFPKGWYNELAIEYRNQQHAVTLQNRLNYQFKNKLTAFADVSYNIKGKSFYLNLGVTWRLPFMGIRSGTMTSGTSTSIYTELSGSMLIHDRKSFSFSDRQSTGTSLKVVLFVDANANGKRDKDEPLIKSPKVILRTPAIERSVTDGIVFSDIPPNVPFKLIVPQQKLGDISWQLADYEKSLVMLPYQTKTIYVPVKVLTEIAGEVYTMKDGEKKAITNIPVIITNMVSGRQVMISSDDWGRFIHMGLTCGKYIVDLHPASLKSRHLVKKVQQQQHTITIKPTIEGQQVDGLDFELMEL